MNSVCVFCGSSPGARSDYAQAARRLGALMADQGLTLVYGGGNVGLMGALANAVLAAGGHVVGVIPRMLVEKELAHTGLAEQHVVSGMHERKQRMEELSDGFLTLPGGWGTFDELCEMMTWSQLGLHGKPVGLLNVSGYFDGLRMQLAHAEHEKFIKPEYRRMLLVDAEPAVLLERMRHYRSPRADRDASLGRP
jgi:uncharacterized protein (TIGR00730 family)